ncbi:hypothetical protein BDZ89DRAFT_1056391 [Hymenopellis radicata]|nr:hypothetical protein BDZ89DRAFT_1056391 [Hymenopellis radicata]
MRQDAQTPFSAVVSCSVNGSNPIIVIPMVPGLTYSTCFVCSPHREYIHWAHVLVQPPASFILFGFRRTGECETHAHTASPLDTSSINSSTPTHACSVRRVKTADEPNCSVEQSFVHGIIPSAANAYALRLLPNGAEVSTNDWTTITKFDFMLTPSHPGYPLAPSSAAYQIPSSSPKHTLRRLYTRRQL